MATRSPSYTAVVRILLGSRSAGTKTIDGTPARAAWAATELARLPVEAQAKRVNPSPRAAASGNCAPQPRQTRWRAGEAVSVGASRADVMEAYLSSSQAGCPGLDGVGTCQARPRHRVVRGGCRGVVGPFPSAPLDEVFNLS